MDNRIENLRVVTSSENQKNMRMPRSNTSGVIGVYKRENGKNGKRWSARITANGKRIFLGSFYTRADAAFVRGLAELEYGFHENHGKRLNVKGHGK